MHQVAGLENNALTQYILPIKKLKGFYQVQFYKIIWAE